MKKLIIATHAGMAIGMKSTLEFLAGDLSIDTVCCYTEEKNLKEYIKNALQGLGEKDKLVIMTDIRQGSVNQMWAEHLGERIYLVSGINLPLLLELALAREEDINDDFIRDNISKAREEIVFMNDELNKEACVDEETFF